MKHRDPAKAAAYRSKAEGHLARASAHHNRLGFGGPRNRKPIFALPEKPWECDCCKSKEEHFEKLAELDKARAAAREKLNKINRTNPPFSSNPGMETWRP